MSKVEIKPAKPLAKANSASGRAPKRPNNDVTPHNTTAEEIAIMSSHMDDLSEDVKNIRENLSNILRKDEMKTFIETTISKIIAEMNENMEVTIALKVDEKTKVLQQKVSSLESENKSLKNDLILLKTNIKTQDAKIAECDKRSKEVLSNSNFNEQYSRKNNVKIMDIKEQPHEPESDLITSRCPTYLGKKM